jgi:AcrR family transcriptional regulator
LKVPTIKNSRSARSARGEEMPPRERILRAAIRAFIEVGYAGTSMLEVATLARVSKRDLYSHFPSKEAVLLACIADRAARMQLAPDLPAPSDRKTLASILTSLGATVIREVCDPAVTAVYRMAIGEAQRAPDVAKILNVPRRANRKALSGLLAAAQTGGILGAGDPSAMMEDFFALLWGDLLLSRMMGAAGVPARAEIDRKAERATRLFFDLYGKRPADRGP